MLTKLLKHELKATSRFLIPLYLILLVVTLLNRVVLALDIFNGALSVIKSFFIFTYIVSNIAIAVVTVVIMIMRFYKNLMTDEGYLMFTLPVKSRELIVSKLLISIFWIITSILAVMASLFAVFGSPENINMFWDELHRTMKEFEIAFGGNTALLIIEFALLIVMGLIQNVLIIYVSIAVGQLFNGHKLVGSFVSYIAINTAMQTILTVLLVTGGYLLRTSIEDLNAIPQIVFPIAIIVCFIVNIVYYFTTEYIFRKKLNLE